MGYSNSASEYTVSAFGTVILPSLAYGVNMTLVSLTLGPLWRRRKARGSKLPTFMTAHIVLIPALCTVHWIISCIEEHNTLIGLLDPSRRRDGSPDGTWERLVANLLYISLTFHTDVLMVGHHRVHETCEILKHFVAVAVFGALC